jgi:hypothetical protein
MMTLVRRRDFGRLCIERGFALAVEVGVDEGTNAEALLSHPGLRLIGVDPYAQDPEVPEYDRQAAREKMLVKLAKYGSRFRLMEMPSLNAVLMLEEAPGLVYIDGCHDTQAVYLDCLAWWERLPVGGILAGHDYDYSRVRDGVDRFVRERGPSLQVLFEEGPDPDEVPRLANNGLLHPSWWMEKHN